MIKQGKKYLIRTVTNFWTGEVVEVDEQFIKLKDAAWIADTGRFANAIQDGTLDEVEPTGEAIVAIGAIVDAVPWNHDLPTEQK